MGDVDFVGTDMFTYEVCDPGNPALCDTATVKIVVEDGPEPLLVFQAVSPNGDGLNDFWFIQGIEVFPNNVVRLFDRWNNLVYEAPNYDNINVAWAGDANKGISSGNLPAGTYFYVVDLGDNSDVLQGFIVLQR